MSGLRINMSKTEGIWLGSLKNYPNMYGGINFTNSCVKCLGIYIGHDKVKCYENNWMSKINKLKNAIHVWKSRKLTLYGKITVLKCLGISKLVYNFSVLPVNNDIIKEINKIVYDFVWNKTDRIKRRTLINTYENGGMRMLDVECMINSMKAAWIPRLCNSKYTASFLTEMLNRKKLSLKILLDGNITETSKMDKSVCINSFYTECITAFNKCKTILIPEKMNVSQFLAQPLFCNTLFTNKGKSLLYSHWIESGICWVKDLYDENGVMLKDGDIYNKLEKRQNWMTEVIIVKRLIGKYERKYNDMSVAKGVNVKEKVYFVICNKIYEACEQRSKFFYNALVTKKCMRTHVEKIWERELGLEYEVHDWENVYLNRIHGIPIKKVANFMYKFIHRLTVSREILKKWKKSECDMCPVCKELESVKHIYFECERVNEMWKTIGSALLMDMTWKKIIFGYCQDITIHSVRNTLLSVIMYSIFSSWMSGIEDTDKFINMNLLHKVKQDIRRYDVIIVHSSLSKMFKQMWVKTTNTILRIT